MLRQTISFCTIVSVGLAVSPLCARADPNSPVRFAPETVEDQRLLVEVQLNGLGHGTLLIQRDSNGVIILPPETRRALHIGPTLDTPLVITPDSPIKCRFDEAKATLDLSVPASWLAVQRFALQPLPEVRLSPETWGVLVDYNVNMRQPLLTANARTSLTPSFGGLADVRLLGPDLIGDFGWAYDSSSGRSGPVRLDSTLSWRPTEHNIVVSVGDSATASSPFELSRAYRFLGVQVGTDFSGDVNWSSAPIASIAGSAQAQSAVDLYLNGQRSFSTVTPGGPFSITLPPGTSGGANLVVTDVTGMQQIVPVNLPHIDAGLIRQDLVLWSLGVGVPRFGYGSSDSTYQMDPIGYGKVRWGAFDRATLRASGQFGAGLQEAEIGADIAAFPDLALHTTFAFSQSDRGTGAGAQLGMSVVTPWNVSFEANATQTFGNYDDIVSVTGRHYARAQRISPLLTVPTDRDVNARVAWAINQRTNVSAGFEMSHIPHAGTVGIASVSANFAFTDSISGFAAATRALGAHPSTTVLAGLSFQLGGAQISASAGANSPQNRELPRLLSGTLNASQPLREENGAVGWSAFGTGTQSGFYGSANAEMRTGYGIPGVGIQSYGTSTYGVATMRGSFGVVGFHPFVADPVSGGIVVVDVEKSGVPVELNGYDRGQTSWDGKIALTTAIAGVPQHIALHTSNLPLDAIPTGTNADVVIRTEGATELRLSVEQASTAARMRIVVHGEPPPVGSTLVGAKSNAPVDKDGRAFLPSIVAGEVLRLEMPDGTACLVHTHFDGRGGVSRRLGTLTCEDASG